MRISVIGTGYVGLVVGTCFAETGNDVICVDIDEKKIRMLQKGKSPSYEPGLEELLKKNIREKRLRFATDIKHAIDKSEVIFLALPTPANEDGSADLRHVLEVADMIGRFLNGYKVIVNKSTVPVGTADKVRAVIAKKAKHEFDVISNPEFLKEGAAVNDFLKPDRIVIGSRSAKAIATMQDLYAPFIRTGNPVIIMDERSSELTKYAANTFLATKISFINEIANLCERVGADVDMVRKGIGTDPRIGLQFLFAGTGYGGSCFPKDVSALAKTSGEHNYDFKILNAVQWVNNNQRKLFADKIVSHFKGRLKGKTIAVWGLSFKPNTDDMREAPSISIITELLRQKAKIQAHDPVAIDEAKKCFTTSIKYFQKNYDALKGADALAVMTEWNEFRRPDFEKMKSLMRGHVIFDGRNIYDPKALKEKGFIYYGIGRGASNGDR
ncbi:MAG: UDP-glucose/GDP-mannose dehydrogenase family protein [Ignavibacteriae bacterium]|nr:UDP-glucose/GDP-mannose dehydrogenase family protein [Ignavibacteria bacterium]MBI3363562.1 UDP-glucose/GDP-mannose dehydrogenase family protein [Ignavibacteriota bacterium]